MAKIPNRTLVAPRDSGAAMPQGAYNSTIRATVGLIQSVGGVADAIVEEGIKAQDLKNETDVRTERRNMREMKAAFDISKVGTDPSTWEQKWKNTLSNYKGSVKSKNYSPVVNRTVSEGFKEFSVNSSIQLTGDALKANRREATASTMLDAQYNMDDQNYQGARDDIQSLVTNGLATPAEAAEKIHGIDRAERRDTLDTQLDADPIKYGEDVKTGTVAGVKLTPADQRRESVRAERAEEVQENKAITVVNERIKAGLVPDEETLDEELEELPISDVHKKLIRKNYGNTKPISYDERTALRDEMNDNFKAFQDGKILLDEYTALHTKTSIKMEDLGGRPGAGGLRSRLHRVNPDQFDPEKDGDTDAARKRALEHKDIITTAGEDIKIRVSAITANALDLRKQGDYDDDAVVVNNLAIQEDKKYGLQIREALDGEVQTWLEGHTTAQLAELTATDVSKYIDSIQATVTSRVNEERKAPLRDTKSETKTEVQISQEKALKWRTPVGAEPAEVPEIPVVTPPKAVPVAEPTTTSITTTNKNFVAKQSTTAERKKVADAGGMTILMDSNWKKGDGVTSPMVVIPDNATPTQRKASKEYAAGVAAMQKRISGKTLKTRVVTRSQNGRGRSNAIHTEGFAITDKKMIAYIKTPKGKAEYLALLNRTFGTIPGVQFRIPHSKDASGAEHDGNSEESIAEWLMS
jgi:hypothetical protein